MDAILRSQAEKLALELAQQATTLDDLNGLMRSLMKSALERMLNSEMDVHLGRRKSSDSTVSEAEAAESEHAKPAVENRRNAASRKPFSGEISEFTLQTPRDRQGTFEPQLILKHQRRLCGFDTLYTHGECHRIGEQRDP